MQLGRDPVPKELRVRFELVLAVAEAKVQLMRLGRMTSTDLKHFEWEARQVDETTVEVDVTPKLGPSSTPSAPTVRRETGHGPPEGDPL